MLAVNTATKTLQLRIKDKHARVLCQMAREVNQVFNFCNETNVRAIRERCQWLSGYDLQKLTAGFSQCDGITIGSGTVQVVCAEYATRRRQFKRSRLNWRVSNPKSSKYSLGWIPFKGGHARYKYRAHEQKLATAQRARKKRRVKALHAQIRNQRKDALHKLSTALVQQNAAIFVGDVASAKLVKTKMAKSTLDAGWSMFKTMLKYKSHRAGTVFEVVNEAYSTQTCSCCGTIPPSSPKGRVGLGIREWACSECATVHDRDVNAARNILAAGHRRLAAGIPAL